MSDNPYEPPKHRDKSQKTKLSLLFKIISILAATVIILILTVVIVKAIVFAIGPD